MKTYRNPPKEEWDALLARPGADLAGIRTQVSSILEAVRKDGDRAIMDLTRRYDRVEIDETRVSAEALSSAGSGLRRELKQAIDTASRNIRAFHSMQNPDDKGIVTTGGVECWVRTLPIDRVGLYVPGGTAPLLSTVLMLAIPARLAGCREIVLCTPPDEEGKIHPAILYCAELSGIEKVFRVGGAQAIAAMAYGTETIQRMDKIFGPGNPYVTVAKQLVSLEGVSIDMPAGPSEQAVLADGTADPGFVASDLLSQAEHGPDSQVILFTTDQSLPGKVGKEIERQLATLPRRETAAKALENSRCFVLDDMELAEEMVNVYAPEHLIIMTEDPHGAAGKIRNAGSVFLGPYTPESAGDYASGTNHTLPTGGYARSCSGLGLESFMKRISYQEISLEGLQNLGPVIMELAREEELEAHRQAVRIRLEKIK